MDGVDPGCLPGIDPQGVPDKWIREIEHDVPVPAPTAGSAQAPAQGVGGSADQLRISKAACAAEA